MPEIRECFIHFKHAHYILVEQLGLGQSRNDDWTLRGLFADATNAEAERKSCLSKKHACGFIDQLDTSCMFVHGQTANQTRIWPGTADAVETIDGLVLSALSYTPRALILKFGRGDDEGMDLQV